MTDQEKLVIDHLARAWNVFYSLPSEHPDELDEFRFHLHALQAKVMARPTRRSLRQTTD